MLAKHTGQQYEQTQFTITFLQTIIHQKYEYSRKKDTSFICTLK